MTIETATPGPAGGPARPGGGASQRGEDARPDDRPDPEGDEVNGGQRLLEPVLVVSPFGDELVERLRRKTDMSLSFPPPRSRGSARRREGSGGGAVFARLGGARGPEAPGRGGESLQHGASAGGLGGVLAREVGRGVFSGAGEMGGMPPHPPGFGARLDHADARLVRSRAGREIEGEGAPGLPPLAQGRKGRGHGPSWRRRKIFSSEDATAEETLPAAVNVAAPADPCWRGASRLRLATRRWSGRLRSRRPAARPRGPPVPSSTGASANAVAAGFAGAAPVLLSAEREPLIVGLVLQLRLLRRGRGGGSRRAKLAAVLVREILAQLRLGKLVLGPAFRGRGSLGGRRGRRGRERDRRRPGRLERIRCIVKGVTTPRTRAAASAQVQTGILRTGCRVLSGRPRMRPGSVSSRHRGRRWAGRAPPRPPSAGGRDGRHRRCSP